MSIFAKISYSLFYVNCYSNVAVQMRDLNKYSTLLNLNFMRKCIYLFLFLFFSVGCTDNQLIEKEIVTQESTATSRAVSKWDFPVKSGTAEWKTLKSRDEKIKKCQIPSEILKSLTTQELVEICANYPLNMDAYAYSNISIGMAVVTASFNGYQELFKRNDNFFCLA